MDYIFHGLDWMDFLVEFLVNFNETKEDAILVLKMVK